MTDIHSLLAEVLDPVPPGLVDYFRQIEHESFRPVAGETGLLNASTAAELTREFHEFHPVIQTLGGFMLDDPNTSDHHFYLAKSPLQGMVLFLSHDGDTRVVYASLQDFIAAAQKADERGGLIADLHPANAPLAADQAALSAFASGLLDDGSFTEVLTAIIPSMDLSDLALLKRLAADEDFYLGEAVAVEIGKRPAAALQEVAELCAAHPHPQVSKPGRGAVGRIRAAIHVGQVR